MRRPFSSAPIRRALAALSAAACAAVLAAGPANAGASGPDAVTSVVVTRLSIMTVGFGQDGVSHGRGWLTLHPRIGTKPSAGFEVFIPAGDGEWSGPPLVNVAEMGISCRRVSGTQDVDTIRPDLHYVCGNRTSDDEDPTRTEEGYWPPIVLPSGGYQVSIPVTRTGSVDGLTGLAWMNAADSDGMVRSFSPDTFPLQPQYRSTAEVRTAPLVPDPDGAGGQAKLSLTTTIVPRESITALDVSLPDYEWRIIGSNAAAHDVRCAVLSGPDSPTLHCQPTAAANGSLPVGRYHLALTLGFQPAPQRPPTCSITEQDCNRAHVSLTAAGRSSEVADTFYWDRPTSS